MLFRSAVAEETSIGFATIMRMEKGDDFHVSSLLAVLAWLNRPEPARAFGVKG